MAKAKPNQKFHLDKLSTALDALDKLDTKPKSELSLRESIYFMRGKLNAALRKGYSYEDLSEILAEQEILVSAATLKLYLTESGKGKKKKSSSSSRKGKSASSSKTSSVSSTNVTLSKEDKESSNSQTEINRIEENESKPISQKTASTDKSKDKKDSKTKNAKAKPRVLSGLDDDLSSEFNQY